MWAQPLDAESAQPSRFRFGFTAYAVRLLQDVYFLDWTIDENAAVAEKADMGSIESKKAESDLFAPMTGTVDAFNQGLLKDPSLINVDKYDRGWLFAMTGQGGNLISPAEYLDHLAAVWEVTQKTIKGQLNS